jgi:glycosyltransferase involved in cell wall biosynthesis
MSRIQILFVANLLRRRGAEQQLFNFMKALPDCFDIHIFRFSKSEDEFPELLNDATIKVASGKYSGTYNLMKFKPLYDVVSEQTFDIVVTVGLGSALFFGRVCALLKNIRIVYSFLNTIENFHHLPKISGRYFDVLNDGLNFIVPRLPGKRVFRFLPNSGTLTGIVKLLVSKYPVDTLHNGFLIREFEEGINSYRPSEYVMSVVKQFEGFPTIVQVGSLDHNKNQMFTLKCVADIKKTIPDIRFLIIGSGPMKAKLVDLASFMELTENAVFAGEMNRRDCLFLISLANVLVLTSDSESFPNVLVEAQALSRPVVAFDVGASSEIVEDGVTGHIVDIKDSAAFSRGIVELIVNKDLSRIMGETGKERVFMHFDMKRKVNTFLSIASKDLSTIYPNMERIPLEKT